MLLKYFIKIDFYIIHHDFLKTERKRLKAVSEKSDVFIMNNLCFEISFIYFPYDIISQLAPSRPQLCGLTIRAYERNRF